MTEQEVREHIGGLAGDYKCYNPLISHEESLILYDMINKPEPHWKPVDLENNKPPLEEWVLVSSDGYVMQDCIVERGVKKIWYHGGNIQSDDRYMPLPEPYKGVTDGRD